MELHDQAQAALNRSTYCSGCPYLAKREVVVEGPYISHTVDIAVALDTTNVVRLRRSFERQVVMALGIIGIVLSFGTWIQSSFGLRPLKKLRGRLARVHRGADTRLTGHFPTEVAPLVDDLNRLL